MRTTWLCGVVLLVCGVVWGQTAGSPSGTPQAGPATLEIDLTKPGAKSSPTLYGIMTEEINFSYDGGLYAELIRNRTLNDDPKGPVHWAGLGETALSIDTTTGPSAALPLSLKISSASGMMGAQNEGFWGIPVRGHTSYKASFYGKADGATGAVTLSLVNDATGKVAASAAVVGLRKEWKQYGVVLKTGALETTANNHFVISFARPGTAWVSLVSLFPPTYKDRVNGMRPDLMELLAGMHPTFLRFPGGNYLEGDHIPERYEWKKTIGALVDRPTHPSPWKYHSSDGVGLLEFLNWCEDLKMQPVLAVYAGYSMRQEHVAPGADLEPYVQDALDEIEYVTGPATSKWGAVRAQNGHPKPFALTYVEVGNEDFFDKSKSYDGRFAQYQAAIKKRYPNLKLIATTRVKGTTPDLIDDHYYKKAEEFYNDVRHYDKTSRDGSKIFVGEWATREGAPTPNFNAALGDSAWMTGMERNSDVILMHGYAPLLVNVNPGGMQWKTDLIGYDALRSYGSPSYYAQVMFAGKHGDEIPVTTLESANNRLFCSVTRDSGSGKLYVKVVNASANPQNVELKIRGANVRAEGILTTMTAESTTATNTIGDPKKIVPFTMRVANGGREMMQVFGGYSVNVLELDAK